MEDNPVRAWALRVCRRHCPQLSKHEIEQAAQNLLDYVNVIWQVHQRIACERQEMFERLKSLRQYDVDAPIDDCLS